LITLPIREFEYSAVITTYQPSQLLRDAVNSILQQSIPPKEIILVDDFTKDLELVDIQNLVPEDIVFIFYSNSQNLGAGFSRNIGVGLSSANYIIFFDDDDVSLPTRSVIHKEAFQNGASVSYVSSRKKYSNGFQVEFPNLEIHPGVLNPKKLAQKLLYGSSFQDSIGDVPSSTLAISKHEFMTIGGFDSSMRRLEDVDLAIRLSLSHALFSWSSVIAVDRTSTYRQYKGGLIDTNHEKILLQKYGYLIGWWRKNYAAALITLRSLYFGGTFSKRTLLSVIELLNPFCILVLITRFPRFLKRLNHDRQQRKK
jgi:GT2 family glycosyltransferase